MPKAGIRACEVPQYSVQAPRKTPVRVGSSVKRFLRPGIMSILPPRVLDMPTTSMNHLAVPWEALTFTPRTDRVALNVNKKNSERPRNLRRTSGRQRPSANGWRTCMPAMAEALLARELTAPRGRGGTAWHPPRHGALRQRGRSCQGLQDVPAGVWYWGCAGGRVSRPQLRSARNPYRMLNHWCRNNAGRQPSQQRQ